MSGASSLPEFDDFDDKDVYARVKQGIEREDTLNFAIEFDSTKACAAHNLDVDSIKRLLNLEASGFGLSTFPGSEGLFTQVLVQCLDADLGIKLATKAFKCEMDVCRSLFINCCYTECAPSNIWAPERQKEVVKVCSDFFNCISSH